MFEPIICQGLKSLDPGLGAAVQSGYQRRRSGTLQPPRGVARKSVPGQSQCRDADAPPPLDYEDLLDGRSHQQPRLYEVTSASPLNLPRAGIAAFGLQIWDQGPKGGTTGKLVWDRAGRTSRQNQRHRSWLIRALRCLTRLPLESEGDKRRDNWIASKLLPFLEQTLSAPLLRASQHSNPETGPT